MQPMAGQIYLSGHFGIFWVAEYGHKKSVYDGLEPTQSKKSIPEKEGSYMKLTVYRQAKKVRPDGTTVYKGEDALPYVDDKIILVADGMGGAAAIRHQKFVPELFEEDKIMAALFEGIYDDYSDPRFVEYVTKSFRELYAVKDCYSANVNNMKKGGYFASRLVAAIVLHELYNNPKLEADALFDYIRQEREAGRQAECLQNLGDYFKDLIQTRLRQIAAKANLVYESSYSGLALLGTTLTLTIYRELEDKVEAVYLTAGDSRPYVWAHAEGLCQAQRDQEGKDGTMTNYIRANEDSDFAIYCAYDVYWKPCMLLNASDGIFDSEYFISPLTLEKLLLDTIVAQPDLENVSRVLEETFDQYGRHDDSSTIALRAFGFDSYEALQQTAQRRLEVIQAQYLDPLPDLLRLNFMTGYAQAEKDHPKKLAALKEKFEAHESVAKYCVDRMRDGVYAPYQQALQDIARQDQELKEAMEQARKTAMDLIAANFAAFVPGLDLEMDWNDRRSADHIRKASDGYHAAASDYTFRLERFSHDLQANIDGITNLLKQIYDLGVPAGFEDYDEDSFRIVEGCERSMDDLFDFFKGLRSHKLEVVRRISQQRREYVQQNMRWAEKHPLQLAHIWAMLESGEMTLGQVHMLEEEKIRLQRTLDGYHHMEQQRRDLREKAEPEARLAAAHAWWQESYDLVILELLDCADVELPEELLEEARTTIRENGAQLAALKEKRDLQVRLLAEYEQGYYRYVGGTEE